MLSTSNQAIQSLAESWGCQKHSFGRLIGLVQLACHSCVSPQLGLQVGSPSPALNGKAPEQCKAKDIAQSVLIDRSTARITSGQRISLSTVENVSQEQKGDYSYIYYEALSQAKLCLDKLLLNPHARSGVCGCCACICMVRHSNHVFMGDDLCESTLHLVSDRLAPDLTAQGLACREVPAHSALRRKKTSGTAKQ